jgi:hypothetical protein
MTGFELKKIYDFDFTKICEAFTKSKKPILFVFSCGYEKRSVSQLQYLQENAKAHDIKYVCFSFEDYKTSGSRVENDELLVRSGIVPIELDGQDCSTAWEVIKNHYYDELNGEAQIYIDYSSMPRSWYCMLAVKMIMGELGEHAALIYSHGKYFDAQYPCVGYGEFHKFSGRPKITSCSEVNVFGLGFDSIRSHGIWTFLDPQLSVTVIARSPNNAEHCERVKRENSEILFSSDSIHEVDVNKFSNMLATLVDLSRKYQTYGDVALVPDGPKPMVAAMSLVPFFLNESGVYCWHVGHVKPDDYEPIDIDFSGEFFGFGVFKDE